VKERGRLAPLWLVLFGILLGTLLYLLYLGMGFV